MDLSDSEKIEKGLPSAFTKKDQGQFFVEPLCVCIYECVCVCVCVHVCVFLHVCMHACSVCVCVCVCVGAC